MMDAALSSETETFGESHGILTGWCWSVHLLARERGKGWPQSKGRGGGLRPLVPLPSLLPAAPVREGRGQPCLPGWQLSNGSKAH